MLNNNDFYYIIMQLKCFSYFIEILIKSTTLEAFLLNSFGYFYSTYLVYWIYLKWIMMFVLSQSKKANNIYTTEKNFHFNLKFYISLEIFFLCLPSKVKTFFFCSSLFSQKKNLKKSITILRILKLLSKKRSSARGHWSRCSTCPVDWL